MNDWPTKPNWSYQYYMLKDSNIQMKNKVSEADIYDMDE